MKGTSFNLEVEIAKMRHCAYRQRYSLCIRREVAFTGHLVIGCATNGNVHGHVDVSLTLPTVAARIRLRLVYASDVTLLF